MIGSIYKQKNQNETTKKYFTNIVVNLHPTKNR